MKAAIAALALAGCAAPAAMTPPAFSPHHVCSFYRADAAGRLQIQYEIHADGTRRGYSVGWVLETGSRYILFNAGSDHLPGPADDGLVSLLSSPILGTPWARTEIRRSTDPDTLLLASSYERQLGPYASRWQLHALRAALGDAPALIVRLVDPRHRLREEYRIERALLDMPAASVAAAQGELDALAADYRNRCQEASEYEDIVVA